MGEAKRRKERGQYPARTAKPRKPARFAARHSSEAVMALLRSMRGKKDDGPDPAALTPKQLRLKKARRALAKGSRRANRGQR